ncbi:MAG: hypothetical protein JRG69_10955 [Deltaproteobacteria bacterium]|nr:hypothetical protein [Deltaproteobacteria bacterium]
MGSQSVQLSKLVNMRNPESVIGEVKGLIVMMLRKFDFEPIEEAFRDVINLFSGTYPGYRKCSSMYHDLQHTTDTIMAMARLMHGAQVRGVFLDDSSVTLGLISALMHDAGFIQDAGDQSGTGAKYTIVHISRSIEFMRQYFIEKGFSREDFRQCRNALLCTGLNTEVGRIRFESKENRLIGEMLGAADLLGQMADRTYLEKLPFLFLEFKEACVLDYADELDFLKKTFPFYRATIKRFENELGGVNMFMRDHFKARWDIDNDLYMDTIEKQMAYLRAVLERKNGNHRAFFRREGIMGKLIQREAELENSSF